MWWMMWRALCTRPYLAGVLGPLVNARLGPHRALILIAPPLELVDDLLVAGSDGR